MKYLVLGPCAMGVFALAGQLNQIPKEELGEVQEVAGASAGAILALMLVVGMQPTEMLEIGLTLDFKEFTKPSLASMLTKYGLVNHEPVKQALIKIFGNPTFDELPPKIKIYISAFCVNTGDTCYFSRDTHPTMRVVDALCMSFTVPFLFEAYEFQGMHYVDGATIEAVPGMPFLGRKNEEVTVLRIKKNKTIYAEIRNTKTFILTLLNNILNPEAIGIQYAQYNTVWINCEDVNLLNFQMEYEQKVKLFLRQNLT